MKYDLKRLYAIETSDVPKLLHVATDGVSFGFYQGLAKSVVSSAKGVRSIDDLINKSNVYDDIIEGTGNLWKNADLLDELSSSGVKYSPDDVLSVTKTGNGKLLWLETGNSKAGMQHILNHADDFARKGIQQDQIQNLVMKSLNKGKIVSYQGRGTGRPIYEVMFNGTKHHTAITVGNNGFVVGANPTTLP